MSTVNYSKRFKALSGLNKANSVSRHLIDADCEYADGAFQLSCLPAKIPVLFTMRFTAPTDFTPGDVFVLKGQEYAVRTCNMEEPEGKLFSRDAVVQCDVDAERELVFFSRGGEQEGRDCEFQSSDLTYYIDPSGDDSPNNPGGADSPFKTLAGAGNTAWRRVIMDPLGRLVFSFNPGTYNLTPAEQLIMTRATHPGSILFRASDISNKPLLKANHFNANFGSREFQGLRLECARSTADHALSPNSGGIITLRDSEIAVTTSGGYVLNPHRGGILFIMGTLAINGNGNSFHSLLACVGGMLWANDTKIVIENVPSVTSGTVYCGNCGHVILPRAAFSGTLSGRRYYAYQNGVIETLGGANFIPGTIAGITATGGIYT